MALQNGDGNGGSGSRQLIIGLVVALLIGGGVFLAFSWESVFGPRRDGGSSASRTRVGSGGSNADSSSQLEIELRIAADVVNRTAPTRVDDLTTLTGARANRNEFTYLYALNEEIPADRLPLARAEIQRQLGPTLCADANIRRIVGRGGVISAEYRDPSGDMIQATIRSCDAPGVPAPLPPPAPAKRP